MKVIRFIVISFSLLVFMANEAFSTDAIDFELTADYVSKYIWRGQNLSDDPVF